jgi:hypothetical protein
VKNADKMILDLIVLWLKLRCNRISEAHRDMPQIPQNTFENNDMSPVTSDASF